MARARAAQPAWGALPIEERAAALGRFGERLAAEATGERVWGPRFRAHWQRLRDWQAEALGAFAEELLSCP